jgi:hypothetical protein
VKGVSINERVETVGSSGGESAIGLDEPRGGHGAQAHDSRIKTRNFASNDSKLYSFAVFFA